MGKVVGKLSQGRWGQVHDFVPEDEAKKNARGRLIAAINIVVEDEVQVQTVALGREALSRLQELYFGQTDLPAMEQLKITVAGMLGEFAGIELSVVAVLDEMVYVCAGGGAGVWVSTGSGKQGWLVKPEKVEPGARTCELQWKNDGRTGNGTGDSRVLGGGV